MRFKTIPSSDDKTAPTPKTVTMTDGDILVIKEVIDVLRSLHTLSNPHFETWGTHIVRLMMLITRYEQATAGVAPDYADSAE